MQHPPPAPSSFDEIFEEPAGSPLNIGLLEYGLPNGSRGLVLQKITPPAQAMHPRLEIGLAVSAVNGEPVTGGMEQVHAYLQVRPLTITFVRSPGTGALDVESDVFEIEQVRQILITNARSRTATSPEELEDEISIIGELVIEELLEICREEDLMRLVYNTIDGDII